MSEGRFILEMEIRVTPRDAKILNKRLEAGRLIYNACLREALRRARRMRASLAWKAARDMKGAARSKAYRECEKRFGFRDYDIQAWTKQFNVKGLWLQGIVGSQINKALASRAFDTVDRWIKNPPPPRKDGRKKKRSGPKIRHRGEFTTIHAISNRQGIRWRKGRILWKGLDLEAVIPEGDPRVEHGLSCPVKYPRIARREIRGKVRWFVQLVLEGQPYLDPAKTLGRGVVGIDLGTQTVAVVGEDRALAEGLAPRADVLDREMRVLDRRIDRLRENERQRRAKCQGLVLDPKKNHNNDYIRACKRSCEECRSTKGLVGLKAKRRDLHRRLAQTRKACHGEMANRILEMGHDIRLEKIDYRSWQRRRTNKKWDERRTRKKRRGRSNNWKTRGGFGKSVNQRAPGEFVRILKYRAGLVGATVTEISTRKTRLSQTCHCGRVEKKSLSKRWHRCPCGVEAQRDLYSAFLCRFVEGDVLDVAKAAKAWPEAEPLLRAAASEIKPNQDGLLPGSFGLSGQGRGRSPGKARRIAADGHVQGDAGSHGTGEDGMENVA